MASVSLKGEPCGGGYLVVPLLEELVHLLLGQAPQGHVEDVVEVGSRRGARVHRGVAVVPIALVLFQRLTRTHRQNTHRVQSEHRIVVPSLLITWLNTGLERQRGKPLRCSSDTGDVCFNVYQCFISAGSPLDIVPSPCRSTFSWALVQATTGSDS